MNYARMRNILTKCEVGLKTLQQREEKKKLTKEEQKKYVELQKLYENLQKRMKLLTEEKGVVQTDDKDSAAKLAKKGVNVNLQKEEEESQQERTVEETKKVGKEVGKLLMKALREIGEEISAARIVDVTEPEKFEVYIRYVNDFEDLFEFKIVGNVVFLERGESSENIGDIEITPSGEININKEVVKSKLKETLPQLQENTIKENINPELTKYVNNFIKGLAKKYGYDKQSAVNAIMQVLRNGDWEGVNEDKQSYENKVKYSEYGVKNEEELRHVISFLRNQHIDCKKEGEFLKFTNSKDAQAAKDYLKLK